MRILSAGGGSGGHITPVVAVLAEIKEIHPEAELRFWTDKKFGLQARQIVYGFDESVRVDEIISGKFRRYHNLAWWKQLLRPFTIVLPNILDMIKFTFGIIQSFFKLLSWRPDAIFLKGGFVCLPIGIAARLLRIPFVIHDSDAHPGLTNRLLARLASQIATGAPLRYYDYPSNISHYTGIPVAGGLSPKSDDERADLKRRLGFDPLKKMVVITGGGLGATRINQAVIDGKDELSSQAEVMLITGKANYEFVRGQVGDDTPGFRVKDFIAGNILDYLSAADVVVARAGATTMLELASLGKPTILVPSIYLTGGHQIKNAKVYEEAGAAIVADERNFETDRHYLASMVIDLLGNEEARLQLSMAIRQFVKPNAAKEVAGLVLGSMTK